MRAVIFTLLISLLTISCWGQEIKIVNIEKPEISFRGLYVVDNAHMWVCGTKGTVGMSYNGGKNFKWVNPKGYENREFIGVYAWDYKNIIVLAAGQPGIILKSKDGGNNWKEVYRDESAGVNLSSMDFYEFNNNKGVIIGNPVGNSYPYVLNTENKGDNWERMTSPDKLAPLKNGENFVAALGGNIKLLDDKFGYIYASAGKHSNFFMFHEMQHIQPLSQHQNNTSGANALEYSFGENYGIIVGGDYSNPESSENNIFLFDYDGTNQPKFYKPQTFPKGHKSGAVLMNNSKAIICGPSGVDFSNDKGMNWKSISFEGFNTCKKAKNGNKIFLVGSNGKIGIFNE